MIKVYSLKKKTTGELHLFEGEMTSNNKCAPNQKSICKKMDKSESEKNLFVCEDINDARLKCAQIGREVCGTCVSHLYTTY